MSQSMDLSSNNVRVPCHIFTSLDSKQKVIPAMHFPTLPAANGQCLFKWAINFPDSLAHQASRVSIWMYFWNQRCIYFYIHQTILWSRVSKISDLRVRQQYYNFCPMHWITRKHNLFHNFLKCVIFTEVISEACQIMKSQPMSRLLQNGQSLVLNR